MEGVSILLIKDHINTSNATIITTQWSGVSSEIHVHDSLFRAVISSHWYIDRYRMKYSPILLVGWPWRPNFHSHLSTVLWRVSDISRNLGCGIFFLTLFRGVISGACLQATDTLYFMVGGSCQPIIQRRIFHAIPGGSGAAKPTQDTANFLRRVSQDAFSRRCDSSSFQGPPAVFKRWRRRQETQLRFLFKCTTGTVSRVPSSAVR